MVHWLLTQAGVAFGRMHTLLQAPQLFGFVEVWTSHPSCSMPLQLAVPPGQGVQTLGAPVQE
jgi:hypothetical protein